MKYFVSYRDGDDYSDDIGLGEFKNESEVIHFLEGRIDRKDSNEMNYIVIYGEEIKIVSRIDKIELV